MQFATHEGNLATDPGETLDLADELALTPSEAKSWLDVPSSEITPDLARMTGFAQDYEWTAWLGTVLRDAGCSVVLYPSWQWRGRPRTTGPFTPRGVIWHHDASPKGPTPAEARFIAEVGRPDEGIPAPLAQCWVCDGCDGLHPVGTWHVLAAGRANHAGLGGGWGSIPEDMGNSLTIGVETDNTTDEKTPAAMYDALVVGSAALLEHMRSDPADWLCGHKEYAAGRKTDPDDIDMDQAREDVAAEISKSSAATPLAPFPGDVFGIGIENRHVEQLKKWLLKLPANAKDRSNKHHPAAKFTNWTLNRVAAFQLSERTLRGDPDGIPGPKTWRLLQLAVRGIG